MGESGRYLYAVTRDVDPQALRDVPALSGGTLEVLEHDEFLAVVSTVDLDEYGEEALRVNLEKLEWLEKAAQTHHAVIEAVSDLGPVAPMRLATIFLDDDSLNRRLDEWRHALTQVLDRVAGRLEWSVKIIAANGAPGASGTRDPDNRPASGADYLRQRKAAVEQRSQRESESQQEAHRIHEVLSARAVATRVLQPQDPRLTGHHGTMVLNAAYLVEAAEGTAFAEEAASCAEAQPHLEVDVKGPWPPYSFAMLEQR
ncbi:GvpL/GvpF family gas vesicle protein [Nocardioides astragali]|uniref:GvpL/GvpF family gas vesicle protein n=1 Tax=Nocardioides astragali TaxID=1776736 RepID=A0ABW2N2Q9_9ACTN|nr:GvpL/GvpF family gas vesicle protein [Nocardioides astragali]